MDGIRLLPRLPSATALATVAASFAAAPANSAAATAALAFVAAVGAVCVLPQPSGPEPYKVSVESVRVE